MKPTKPLKRSVSPFEPSLMVEERPFAALETAWRDLFPETPAAGAGKPALSSFSEAVHLPQVFQSVAAAPAGDAAQLEALIQYLLRFKVDFEVKGAAAPLFAAMLQLFELKTALFLLTHYEAEACRKMGWGDAEKDVVLFAKERDQLVGRFFGPWTEAAPGHFSEFVNRWKEATDTDRRLHLLDFLAGAKNPTLDHYLLFAHPSLQHLLRDKPFLKSLLHDAQPALKKWPTSPWEAIIKKSLDI